MKTYLGIDNGVSGSLAVIYPDNKWYVKKMPVKEELNYTKTKRMIRRIDTQMLSVLLVKAADKADRKYNSKILILIERPMVNPGRFQSTVSALRALEATLICVENYSLPYQYVDSKEWQRVMLPSKLKGSDQLKKASKQIGERLFPGSSVKGDCDSILMAEWARRKNL